MTTIYSIINKIFEKFGGVSMYCKNCGRQLKEGMRFCDRCGQSVRKNKQTGKVTKRQEIEERKEERLNRKKRLEEKEAKQALSKQRKKRKNKGGNTAIFIIIIALIAVAAFILGYQFIGSDSSNSDSDTGNQLVQNNKSTSKPNTAAADVTKSKNGYSSISIGNLTCPYPTDFRSNTTSNYEKLNLTDPLGGATMVVSQDGKTDEPKNLMRDYLNEIGGTVADGDSHAGSDWYTITINTGDKVHHRKCIVRNGIAVYYDFVYNRGSSSESKYKEYIDYIDSNFK